MIILASLDTAVRGSAGIPVAFVIGAISFFTPCVLPLVPGYLSYVSGMSAQELEEGGRRGRVLFGTMLFVLGFAIAFTLLGAAAGEVSHWLASTTARFISGGIVVLMGLIFLGSSIGIKTFASMSRSENNFKRRLGKPLLRIVSVFAIERGFHAKGKVGLAGAVPLGAAFALTWTPCASPGLAVVLNLALPERSPLRGAFLLFIFSLGFGVWFVLGAIGFRRMMKVFSRMRRILPAIVGVGGVFMIAIGILIFTNQWQSLFAPLQRWFIF